jgi:hypothetical protein
MPLEVWEQVAAQTPRYHLRPWLSASSYHRDIASRHIFQTLDLYFLEFESYDRELDILDRAVNDPVFATRVKSLRLHWDYARGDTMDLLLGRILFSLSELLSQR